MCVCVCVYAQTMSARDFSHVILEPVTKQKNENGFAEW